jgi:hypothetical protein
VAAASVRSLRNRPPPPEGRRTEFVPPTRLRTNAPRRPETLTLHHKGRYDAAMEAQQRNPSREPLTPGLKATGGRKVAGTNTTNTQLAAALGRRFKVNLPYRARKAQVSCRRCLMSWWIPREGVSAEPGSWTWIRGHRCRRRQQRLHEEAA